VANLNRRNNIVESLVVNGIVSSYSSKIREQILQFYTRLYSEKFSWQPKLDGLSFNAINTETVDVKAFEESEVFEVMKALNGDKALGPDGSSLVFFQSCWEILKEDIVNVFHEFHPRRKFERSLQCYFYLL
jgi:hypothetical protein